MKVLILANKSTGLNKFRGEILEALISKGHEVFISVPNGDFIDEMKQMGCRFIETEISRHGTNPLTDLALTKKYCAIIKSVKPDIICMVDDPSLPTWGTVTLDSIYKQ